MDNWQIFNYQMEVNLVCLSPKTKFKGGNPYIKRANFINKCFSTNSFRVEGCTQNHNYPLRRTTNNFKVGGDTPIIYLNRTHFRTPRSHNFLDKKNSNINITESSIIQWERPLTVLKKPHKKINKCFNQGGRAGVWPQCSTLPHMPSASCSRVTFVQLP